MIQFLSVNGGIEGETEGETEGGKEGETEGEKEEETEEEMAPGEMVEDTNPRVATPRNKCSSLHDWRSQ